MCACVFVASPSPDYIVLLFFSFFLLCYFHKTLHCKVIAIYGFTHINKAIETRILAFWGVFFLHQLQFMVDIPELPEISGTN